MTYTKYTKLKWMLALGVCAAMGLPLAHAELEDKMPPTGAEAAQGGEDSAEVILPNSMNAPPDQTSDGVELEASRGRHRYSGGGGMARREANTHWESFPGCVQIKRQYFNLIKSDPDCYLKLFAVETGCSANMHQRRGNAGNGMAAYGICSMEHPPQAGRPRDCWGTGLASQIKCCVNVVREFTQAGSYFGPIRRGSVRKCH